MLRQTRNLDLSTLWTWKEGVVRNNSLPLIAAGVHAREHGHYAHSFVWVRTPRKLRQSPVAFLLAITPDAAQSRHA